MGKKDFVIDPIIESVELNDEGANIVLKVPVDLLYLKGHFDQEPLLPGVVQVDWAIRLGRRYLDLPAHFLRMEVLKFQELILPGHTITLSLQYKADKGKLFFSYASKQGQHSSGRIVLE